MFKKARKDAFERVSEDFRAANETLEEVQTLLAKIGGTLGADLSGSLSSLSGLALRLKKTIAAGNLSSERPEKKKSRDNNGLTE